MNKVIKISVDGILFDNQVLLRSDHDKDCCENHYLSFFDLSLEDFKDLKFDLSNDNFFKRVKDYGIELIPINGWSIKIPGYGYNNGYYSTDLVLQLKDLTTNKILKEFDITECQVINKKKV